MTTHPNSLHNGIPIKERLWRLNTEEAHLPEDFRRDDVNSVHLLVIRREHCGNGKQLTSFDAFPRSDPTASHMESLLQLFLRAATHLKQRYMNARDHGQTLSYPFQLYLEVVFESDEFRKERLAADASGSGAASGVHNIRHQVMRDVLNFPDAELERVKRAQSGVVDHTLTTFMSEIGTGREVREYRLWFMCSDNTVHFKTALNDILRAAVAMHDKRITPTTLVSEDRNLMKQHAALIATGDLPSQFHKLSSIATDIERWALFESIPAYLKFVAVYTGLPQYASEAVARAAMSNNIDLNNELNPANPNNIYAPTAYFKRDLRHIYAPQAQFENYCTSAGNSCFHWRFPLPSCVIEVPIETMDVAAFCCKLTPDHQARVIQPRLSKEYYPPICRLRGSTLFAKVMAAAGSFEALRRGEAMPHGVATTEQAAAAAALERARRPLDPVAEARANRVTAAEAGVDTDDEEDIKRRVEDEVADVEDLGEAVVQNVRNEAEIRKLEARRKKLMAEVAGAYMSKDPATLRGWNTGTVPLSYDAPMPEDETGAASTGGAGGELLMSGASNSTMTMSTDSNGGTERSLAASQQVSAAERARLATYDHGDAKSRKHERAVNETANGGVGMTVLDTLAAHFKHHLGAQRRQITDEAELTLRYTTDQDMAFAEYANNCCSSTSAVSAVGCTLNRFWEAQLALGTAHVHTDIKMVDKRLATFGVIVSQMTLDYDKACAVFAAHREALFLTFAACDTYRHEYNLHVNLLFYGEAAVSKSFVLEMIERLAVDGTVRSINAKTAAAANISESRDDLMDIYQEFRATWLVAPPTSGGSARPDANKEHDQFKERIGTCRVTTEFFYMTPDGKRTALLAHSSQIGNFGGATNLIKSVIAPPMLSRVWAIAMLPMRSSNIDMAECDAASRAQSQARLALTLMAEVQHDYRMFQLWHYHVEKLIYEGGLAEPTLAVFNLYMPTFRRVLATHSISVPIRTMWRMEKLLRTLVIREALWRTFVLPGAPFRGVQFRIEQLKYLDPWLRDNQKMVFWLFEASLDQYVDVYETVLVEGMRNYFAPKLADVLLFKREASNDSAIGDGTRRAAAGDDADFNNPAPMNVTTTTAAEAEKAAMQSNNKAGSNQARDNAKKAAIAAKVREANQPKTPQHGVNKEGYRQTKTAAAAEAAAFAGKKFEQTGDAPPVQLQHTTSSGAAFPVLGFAPSGLALIKPECQSEFNFQRVRLGSSVADAVRNFASVMNLAVRPLSPEQIKEQLHVMAKRTIKTRRYVQDPRHGAPNHPYPVMPDPQDLKEYKISAVFIDWNRSQIYIASALLFAEHSNPAAAVIDQCFDRWSPPGDVYVSGFAYKPDMPSLFDVRPMRNFDRPNLVFNHAALDPDAMKWVRGGAHYQHIESELRVAARDGRRVPPWVTKEAYVVDCHVDQYATRVRLHRIALPWDNADLVAMFDVRRADEAWKAQVKSITDERGEAAKYPEDAAKKLFNVNRGKRVRDEVDARGKRPITKNSALNGYRVDDLIARQLTSVSNKTARTMTSAKSFAGNLDVTGGARTPLRSADWSRAMRRGIQLATMDSRHWLTGEIRALPGMDALFKNYRELREGEKRQRKEIAAATAAFISDEIDNDGMDIPLDEETNNDGRVPEEELLI